MQQADSQRIGLGVHLVRAMRPAQWTKNAVVGAAFFFAFFDRTRDTPLTVRDGVAVLPGVLVFCLLSSAVYILNDLRDIEADRQHPVKRLRPIAAGQVSRAAAAATGLGLLLCALAGSWFVSPRFGTTALAYVVLQIAYTFLLKRVAFVDLNVIAAGFVLRAIAGAVIFTDVTISPWLLLCTYLLALFLGLCKRRHEKELLNGSDTGHRESLGIYDARLLDQLIAMTSGATIVVYSIYTLWPETVGKFGTSALGFTIPFVVFGIFRYLELVYRHGRGGRPEKVLLTDVPLLIDLALYGLSVLTILRLSH